MKINHINYLGIISDTHLGKRMFRSEENGNNKYEIEGYRQFNKFVDSLLGTCDVICFSGDIFDEPNPKTIPLNEFDKNVKRILENNQGIIAVSGNHEFSFRNKNENSHCISNILNNQDPKYFDNIIHVEYNIDYFLTNDQLIVLVPFLYADKKDNDEIWKDVVKICNTEKRKQNILITHGVHESWNISNQEHSIDFMIPEIINEYFDLMIIGHVHTPIENTVKTARGFCKIISPGSSILINKDNEIGPLRINLNEEIPTIERTVIPSIQTKKIIADKNNINDILYNIKNDIYNIEYYGEIKEIDNDLYIKALDKAICIHINIINDEKEKKEYHDIGTFWDFIKNSYPSYEAAFNNIKNKINS